MILTAISLAAGGAWTIKTYFDQERLRVEQERRMVEQRADEAKLNRQKLISEFARELGDPQRRNGAAYALAEFAGQDALSLLVQHFIGSLASERDASFRDALTQAFIKIGDPSLPELVRVNRDAAARGTIKDNRKILATQAGILHFLRQPSALLARTDPVIAGVVVINADLAYSKIDKLNLGRLRMFDTNLCKAGLQGADLTDTIFGGVELGSARLENARLDRTEFGAFFERSTELGAANMDRAQGRGARLHSVSMRDVSMVGAVLIDTDFREAVLNRGNLRDATLTGSDLRRATLREAKLAGATLIKITVDGADLGAADLSRTKLSGTRFGGPYDRPFVFRGERGPYVVRANLDGAAP